MFSVSHQGKNEENRIGKSCRAAITKALANPKSNFGAGLAKSSTLYNVLIHVV